MRNYKFSKNSFISLGIIAGGVVLSATALADGGNINWSRYCTSYEQEKITITGPDGRPALVDKYSEQQLLDMGCPGRYTWRLKKLGLAGPGATQGLETDPESEWKTPPANAAATPTPARNSSKKRARPAKTAEVDEGAILTEEFKKQYDEDHAQSPSAAQDFGDEQPLNSAQSGGNQTPTNSQASQQRDLFDETGIATDADVYRDMEAQKAAANNSSPHSSTASAQSKYTAAEAPKKDEDSFLRKHAWGNSFDEASDASYNAAKAAAKCAGNDKDCAAAMKTANDVSKTQAKFADVSRVSDAAALAAVGGSAYAEVGKRDDSQAGSLKSVANIHKMASKAELVSGATDVTLGAAAYLSQQKTLEEQKQIIEKQLQRNDISEAEKKALVTKYNAAIEKTNSASMKHIGWGLGKLAVSAFSSAAAKSAENQAKALESVKRAPIMTPNIGVAPVYGNNQPMFGTAGSTSVVGMNAPGLIGSSTGGSVAGKPGASTANSSPGVASLPVNSSGGSIASTAAPSTSGNLNASGTKVSAARTPASVGESPNFAKDEEITYGNDGGSGTSGKSASASGGSGGFSNIVSSILGKGGIVPQQGADMDQAQQANAEGLEPGIGSSDESLFDQVRAKHMKALASGNLAGLPGGAK